MFSWVLLAEWLRGGHPSRTVPGSIPAPALVRRGFFSELHYTRILVLQKNAPGNETVKAEQSYLLSA